MEISPRQFPVIGQAPFLFEQTTQKESLMDCSVEEGLRQNRTLIRHGFLLVSLLFLIYLVL